MQFVEPQVYLLGQTQMNREAVRKWLDDMGAVECPIDTIESISDAEQIVGLAGKRCYKSFQVGLNPNVSKIRKEWDAYFDNVLKAGHGSVTEHANYTWAFENVSRVFTAEMNRHRAGVAISEQSLRYVRFNNIPFWLPDSVQVKDGDEAMLRCQKVDTQDVIREVLEVIEQKYLKLVKIWDFDNMKDFKRKKEITSLLRRIAPLGVATGGVWTMNGRAIRHVITMRAAPEAEEEIALVFSKVAKQMVEAAPFLLKDFKQTEEGFWYPAYRKV